MHTKACRIENYISQLPLLDRFDNFAVLACGFYCLEDCSYGFPNLVLMEYSSCLIGGDRQNQEGDAFSNIYVKVSHMC